MRTRPLFATFLLLAVGATTALFAAAQPPKEPAPPLPVIHGADIPSEPSERPKEAEWKDARNYSVTRGHPDRCQLSVVREWLRVVCKDSPGIGLVAGDPKGVTTWIQGDLQYLHPLAAVVELPLTRGASRIVTILDLDGGEYDGLGVGEDSQLSVTWRAGEANPVIALYQINEPFDGG